MSGINSFAATPAYQKYWKDRACSLHQTYNQGCCWCEEARKRRERIDEVKQALREYFEEQSKPKVGA